MKIVPIVGYMVVWVVFSGCFITKTADRKQQPTLTVVEPELIIDLSKIDTSKHFVMPDIRELYHTADSIVRYSGKKSGSVDQR